LHYQDPHGPYRPPERLDQLFPIGDRPPRLLELNAQPTGWRGIPSYQQIGESRNYHDYVARYDREIRYMDEQVGRFLGALKERGLYDNSLIIFTSDHGEGMGEHDYYFAHGESLYRELLHVPLIMRYGRKLRGRRPDVVQHLDLVPTILNLLGLRHEFRYRGRDLRVPAEAPPEIIAEMPAFHVPTVPNSSVMVDGIKLIHIALKEEPWHSFELYDTRDDPDETVNLMSLPAYRERFEELAKTLDRIRGEDFVELAEVAPPPERSEEELEHLRSLGYVGD
jgi:arylsulfatase